jgi:hypothetical protein
VSPVRDNGALNDSPFAPLVAAWFDYMRRARGSRGHTRRVSTRPQRLIIAGVYVAGIAGVLAGLAIEFTASDSIGQILMGVGALLTVGARLHARWRHLPAP